MTDKVTRPRRLDLVDLPRDKQRALGSLRGMLVAAANYCKRYPAKLAVLKETLKYVYTYCVEVEQADVAIKEAKSNAYQKLVEDFTADPVKVAETIDNKLELDKLAGKIGIELDRRKTLEDMRTDLAMAVTEQSKQTNKQDKPATKPTTKKESK
jgi:hypothetical protein